MAFEFFRWLREKMSDGKELISSEKMSCAEFFGISSELYVRELAFYTCVDLIARAISKCEFKTFINGKETKSTGYYTWNISPNNNQCSSAFLHKLISQLYRNNEALIIQTDDKQLLVADSFGIETELDLEGHIFGQVTVGAYTFKRTFKQDEVMYFKLGERNMRHLVNGLYDAYKKLIDYGMNAYKKSRGTKGVVYIDTIASGNRDFQQAFNDLKNQDFRTFAEAENAVLPLYKGMTYSDIGSKTYSYDSSRDIRAMIDDIGTFTARAFGVPPALISGDVQGVNDALEQFLTFCIDPLTDMLSEEINRKTYGKKEYLKGNYIQIDTKAIKHVDLLSVSTAIDKLVSSGAFCINDIREVVGEPKINESWAETHFMTKNYATVQDLLTALNEEVTE